MDTGIYFLFYFMMQMDSFFKDKIQRYNDKKNHIRLFSYINIAKTFVILYCKKLNMFH